jgi:hypothetical protein
LYRLTRVSDAGHRHVLVSGNLDAPSVSRPTLIVIG